MNGWEDQQSRTRVSNTTIASIAFRMSVELASAMLVNILKMICGNSECVYTHASTSNTANTIEYNDNIALNTA